MSVLANFEYDKGKNFWKLNPQFRIPGVFKEFHDKDKSKGKSKSSLIMWAIALLVEHDSEFYNLLEEEKRSVVAQDFLEDSKFDWTKCEEIIEAYRKLRLTKLQRDLQNLERKLEERAEFISTTPYSLDEASNLDKIITNTGKLYDLITQLRDKVKEESTEGVTRGGRKESAIEKGVI